MPVRSRQRHRGAGERGHGVQGLSAGDAGAAMYGQSRGGVETGSCNEMRGRKSAHG